MAPPAVGRVSLAPQPIVFNVKGVLYTWRRLRLYGVQAWRSTGGIMSAARLADRRSEGQGELLR
jgi:hypothetical protein